MSEQDKSGKHDTANVNESGGQVKEDCGKPDIKPTRPVMLYRALLEEYEALGTLNCDEIRDVENFKREQDNAPGAVKYEDSHTLSEEEQAAQFVQRQTRRFAVMSRLRTNLHLASTRGFRAVRSKYVDLFAGSGADEKDSFAAADMATLLELRDKHETKKKDTEKIIAAARALSLPGKVDDLRHQEVALEDVRGREVSNSLTALCLSGGGIRSATFCLGVVQSLANHGLLGKFHYLSSVSGGGYIASWLSAWIYRAGCERKTRLAREAAEKAKMLAAAGLPKDDKADATDDTEQSKPGLLDTVSVGTVEGLLNTHLAETPEPAEITHLRKFSNYMSPTVGMFSTDTWALVAVYVRNLLLNWTVIIPLVAALLLVPRVLVSVLRHTAGANRLIAFGAAVLGGLMSIVCITMMRPSFKNYSPLQQVYSVDDIGSVRPSNVVRAGALIPLLLFAFGLTAYWGGTFEPVVQFPWAQTVLLTLFAPLVPMALSLGGFVGGSYKTVSEISLGTFVLFGIALYLTGYLLAWGRMGPKYYVYRKEKREAEAAAAAEAEAKAKAKAKAKANAATATATAAPIPPATKAVDESGNPVPGRFKRMCGWVAQKFSTYVSEFLCSLVSGALGGLLLYAVVIKLFSVDADNPSTIFGIDKFEFLLAFGVPLILSVFLLAATLFTGLAARFTSDDDREWVTRFGALILKTSLAWIVVASAVIFGPLIFDPRVTGLYAGWIKWLVGAGTAVSGAFSAISGFSSKTAANDKEPAKDRTGLAITIASSIAAPICVLFLIILTAWGTQGLIGVITGSEIEKVIAGLRSGDLEANIVTLRLFYEPAMLGVLAFVGAVMGVFVNINKFSFHSTYRDRLIRAYLGASNRERLKQANSFTGFDSESDNVAMTDLKQTPLHVVNMTLNMVRSDNLAWQNRKAESFTATALHSGSSQMGGSGNYRRSHLYGVNKRTDRAITLGTAAAISGAAVSPNMGYFTQSTAVAILMVLLNVRLGWWLGNPGRRGDRSSAWTKAAPSWSPLAFFSEAFERTDDTHPYVYLADGGQFENLGLYEMVLRRCKTIIVCDAGADPKPAFYDLGSAIHKIKVDMGIPIDFEKTPENGKYGAIASIRYSAVDGPEADDGTIIYIKPTLNGSESIDVQHYHNENSTFPHETTADQFYSETQFESYRSLGFNMMESLSKGPKIKDLADLVANVKNNL